MKDRITTLLYKSADSGVENRYDPETLERGREIIKIIYKNGEFIDHEQFETKFDKALHLLTEYLLVESKFKGNDLVYFGDKKEIEEIHLTHLKNYLRSIDEIMLKDKFHFKIFKYFRDDVDYLETILIFLSLLFVGWLNA